MGFILQGIEIENFKSYVERQYVRLSDMSVLLGANSSGKSTALQTLLVIKQTMECNSADEELLLSGKYVALGDYDDVISSPSKNNFSFAVVLKPDEISENTLDEDKFRIEWKFKRAEDGTSASLDCIDIYFENVRLMMKKFRDEIYDLYIDEKPSVYSVKIHNLLSGEYIMHYEKELNAKVVGLLNSLTEILISPKTAKISSDEFVGDDALKDFYFKLMERGQNNNINKGISMEQRKVREKLASRIETLIESFCDMKLPVYNIIDRIMPKEVRVQILKRAILDLNSIECLEKILVKYENYVKESGNLSYEIKTLDGTYKLDGKYKLDGTYNLGRDPFWSIDRMDRKDNNLSQLKYALDFYNSFYGDIVSRIFFVGPIRENPKGLYNIGFETVPKYVGPSGSYFASVLLHENKKEREYILPRGRKEITTLSEALSEWLTHLNIASEVDVDKKNSFGFSVSVENMEQVRSDIMNVGIGTSQVLPVLISVLLSEEGETLIFEQPELHLHPYSQSHMADMFVEFCKHGRKIIVETHSEYFLLRLRYHIVKGNCPKESISVNFFQNNEGTKVVNKNISGLGNIEYPKDFRDETQELLDSILNAALERKGL